MTAPNNWFFSVGEYDKTLRIKSNYVMWDYDIPNRLSFLQHTYMFSNNILVISIYRELRFSILFYLIDF